MVKLCALTLSLTISGTLLSVSYAFFAADHENHREIVLSSHVLEKFSNLFSYFSAITLHNKF